MTNRNINIDIHRSVVLRQLFFAIGLLLSISLFAQNNYPADYFRPPVDFRMLLSGTFGEIRTNHLHSGIDIKTNGTEGARVYAVADGYVSRISVSPYGFGKALYITHPNGYTSVYGHLRYFAGPIHDYVMKEHYRRESFEMNIYLDPATLPVKKGDLVAFSGNSGSSGGPHLHFEMRNDATQDPINPLLFGYEVKDQYTPRMTWLKIYAVGPSGRINGMNKDLKLQVEGWGREHRLSSATFITASGKIAFGIQCHDQQDDTDNKNGAYEVRVYADGLLISETRMESFAFSNSRCVNSLLDYEEYMRSGMRFQRTEKDAGNFLPVYEHSSERGTIFINDTKIHEVTYEVTDAAGNLSQLKFSIQGQPALVPDAVANNQAGPDFFNWNTSNHYEAEGFTLDAPKGCFYRDFRFTYSETAGVRGCYGGVHHVHDKYTPVQDNITIRIRPEGLPGNLREKALLVRVEDNGGLVAAGGEWGADGMVSGSIREFGNYSVAVDTVSPVITAIEPSYHKNLAGRTTIKFTITDKLSGIRSYRGTLNGEWILMDYDAKNDALVYYIEEHMKPGNNEFRLEVTDQKNNIKVYRTNMVR